MKINTNTLVSEIVSENYNTAKVFKTYGIDFCCNGNRTLQAVSNQQQLEVEDLIAQIKEVTHKTTNPENYQDWELDALCDYIYKTHHLYVERQSTEILTYLEKLCKIHGAKHPELFVVTTLFKEAVGDLATHMKKEELILFPYIKSIATAFKTNTCVVQPSFGSIHNPISMMHEEHDNEGERFRKISKLTNGYTPPEDACNTYKVAYGLLQEFEADLHKHIHIENNILFKNAIALEQQLNH